MNKGMIKFFVKETTPKCTTYKPVEVSIINNIITVQEFTDTLYHHPETQEELKSLIGSKLGKSQSAILSQDIKSNPSSLSNTGNTSSVIFDATSSVIDNQLSKIPVTVVAAQPSVDSVNLSKNIASSLASSKNSSQHVTFVQIPSSPMPLSSSNSGVPGSVNLSSKTISSSGNLGSQLISQPASSASVQIDSKLLALSPQELSNAINSGALTVVPSSAKSNPISSMVTNGSQNVLGSQNIQVTPVSSDLSVITFGSSKAVPVPSSSTQSDIIGSILGTSSPNTGLTKISSEVVGPASSSSGNELTKLLASVATTLGVSKLISSNIPNNVTPYPSAATSYSTNGVSSTVNNESLFDLASKSSGQSTGSMNTVVPQTESQIDFSKISSSSNSKSGSKSKSLTTQELSKQISLV